MTGNNPRDVASSPCYQHEFDALDNASSWDVVRAWRVKTRAELLAYRDPLTERERARLGDAIMQCLRSSEVLMAQPCIGFYWPMPGEIDLRPLLTELVAAGKTAALPVITGRDEPLEFWRWRPDDVLDATGLWGIPVPAIREVVAVTALLVPTLGFDDAHHRLGYGGGYYDRTLAGMAPRPVSIGVAYEASRLRSIYPQAHDIPMDFMVTDAACRARP